MKIEFESTSEKSAQVRMQFDDLFRADKCHTRLPNGEQCDRRPARGRVFCWACLEDRAAGRKVVFTAAQEMLPNDPFIMQRHAAFSNEHTALHGLSHGEAGGIRLATSETSGGLPRAPLHPWKNFTTTPFGNRSKKRSLRYGPRTPAPALHRSDFCR